MQDLIKVEERKINGELVQTVNARDLYDYLENKGSFSYWIKNKIESYGFRDGVDYIKYEVVIDNTPQQSQSSLDSYRENQGLTFYNRKIEYGISIKMAKKIAMVDRSDKGDEIREYFIECERIAKNAVANPFLTMSRTQLLEYALSETRKVEQLESVVYEQNEVLEEKDSVIKEQQPKVEFYNDVAVAENAQPVGEVAKVLGTGQRKLFKWLRDGGYLMSTGTLPYQRFINSGLFEVKETKWSDDFGRVRINCQTLITGKGLIHIQKRFRDIASNDDDMVAFG